MPQNKHITLWKMFHFTSQTHEQGNHRTPYGLYGICLLLNINKKFVAIIRKRLALVNHMPL